jgi:membrane-associated phospholipid phosphatase
VFYWHWEVRASIRFTIKTGNAFCSRPMSRLAPKQFRPLVRIGILGLASTRTMLLAHYASDVVAGLAIGAALGKAVRKLTE